jgi:hypothetical protein
LRRQLGADAATQTESTQRTGRIAAVVERLVGPGGFVWHLIFVLVAASRFLIPLGICDAENLRN